MAAKKSKKKPAKKKAGGSVGILNANQRKQLEALGDVSPAKNKKKRR